MRYLALATDYDGTLSPDGALPANAASALERLRASRRRAIVVTGRHLGDFARVCPRLDLFDCVVGENGCVLHFPASGRTEVVHEPLPDEFLQALRTRGVPHDRGDVIVNARHPAEHPIVDAVREIGIEVQLEFNGDAVMVLPRGASKGDGLERALRRMGLSPQEVVAIGNAANDHSLLAIAGLGVAVADAIPSLRKRAALVTAGGAGDGVVEVVEHLLGDDARDRS